MQRLTKPEWRAISTALGQCLAAPLDGFDEDDPETQKMVNAMESAQQKVWERIE